MMRIVVFAAILALGLLLESSTAARASTCCRRRPGPPGRTHCFVSRGMTYGFLDAQHPVLQEPTGHALQTAPPCQDLAARLVSMAQMVHDDHISMLFRLIVG